MHRVWQTHVPTLALRLANYPNQAYLLHAVLAVAGLHAAKIRFGEKKESIRKKRKREEERNRWLVIARMEHQLCLEGFQAAVASFASRGVELSGSGGPCKGGGHGWDNIHSPEWDGEQIASKYHGGGSREDEELEAVLLASLLLSIYAFSISTLEMDQETDREAKRKTPTSLGPSSGSSPSTSQPAPLTWLPLIRGAPAIICRFPFGWRTFYRGHLAPLTVRVNLTVKEYPYKNILSSLSSLLSPAYELHPRLSQPALPLTGPVFTKVIKTMKWSFKRFFTYEPIAAAMNFLVKVNDEFVASVLGSRAGDKEACDGIMGGDSDPRSLVIMAHFMVLIVMIEFLLPGEKEVMGLSEAEWRGGWDEYESDDDGDEPGRNSDERGLERDTRRPNGTSPQFAQCDIRLSVTRGWWASGLGRREIVDIARYLQGLDAEEARMDIDGLVGGVRGRGRWMNSMKWPLDMIQGDVAAREAHAFVPQDIVEGNPDLKP